MRLLNLLCLVVLLLLACQGFGKQDNQDPPPLLEVDFDRPESSPKELSLAKPGWLAQISLVRPFQSSDKKKQYENAVRTLKVEITGDAIANVALVVIPVQIKGSFGPTTETGKRRVACLLKAVKDGTATVKITPIGYDGKERPSQEWKVRVGKKMPEKDPLPR
jgi:hypothetical protein